MLHLGSFFGYASCLDTFFGFVVLACDGELGLVVLLGQSQIVLVLLLRQLGVGLSSETESASFGEMLDMLRQLLHTAAAAHINADRNPFGAAVTQEVDRFPQQLGGQIVNAIVATVFEHLQSDAFA